MNAYHAPVDEDELVARERARQRAYKDARNDLENETMYTTI
jgi:hypothetical protein